MIEKQMRRNIKLVISYDGTAYSGWQKQPAGKGIGVQQIIEDVLHHLCGDVTHITGAGRTDAGVHSLGQTANFYTQSPIPTERIAYAVNNLLPRDIRILQAEEVAADFHARYDTIGKTYCYYVTPNANPTVFQNKYSWYVDGPLDGAKMQEAASYFLGTHNFYNFAASGSSVQDFVRRIDVCDISFHQIAHKKPWLETDGYWCFRLTGNGFLYKMVRNMVGTLVLVGKGKLEPTAVPALITAKEKPHIAPAPAHGLFMEQVYYAPELYEKAISLRENYGQNM